MNRDNRHLRIIRLLVCQIILCIHVIPGNAFLCEQLQDSTWGALLALLETSDLVILCPFEIRGNGCDGSLVHEQERAAMEDHQVISTQTLVCDQTYLGPGTPSYPEETNHTSLVLGDGGNQTDISISRSSPTGKSNGCIIDCPGNHITIKANASLTVDGFTFRGSQSSSVIVESEGEFRVFASTFERNTQQVGNGGAIHLAENAFLLVNQCDFVKNSGLSGGALFLEGESQITESKFVDNQSTSSSSMAGGGAIAIGVFATTFVGGCEFEGGSAVTNTGVAIVDHSNGFNTVSVQNDSCNITGSCNGIERVNSITSPECEEFESCAVVEAQERPTISIPSEAYIPSLVPVANAATRPSLRPTHRPTPAPTTLMPTTDPCLEDAESFECMLHELLEALP